LVTASSCHPGRSLGLPCPSAWEHILEPHTQCQRLSFPRVSNWKGHLCGAALSSCG
jgi:hypothetical protein